MGNERVFASDDLRSRFNEDGCVCPIRVASPEEAGGMRAQLERYVASSSVKPKDDPLLQYKVHMVFRWADDLVHRADVLDAVEALIGPDILVWNTAVLLKKPHTGDFVTWHQDAYYWGNHPEHVVTAWISLADSTPETGCVRAIPGSHRWGILPHVDTYGEENMLSRGQQIDPDRIDTGLARDLVLGPGEMSLHHTRTVHCSHPNRSERPRIGFVITFMSPAARMNGPRTGAMLVRGRDDQGHFSLETFRPTVDLDSAARVAHEQAMQPFLQAIFEGAEKEERTARTAGPNTQ